MLDAIHHQPNRRLIEPRPEPKLKKKHRRFRFILGLTMLILLCAGIFIGSKVISLAQQILDKSNSPMSFGQLFLSSDKPLSGEDNGEIRILLMGIGGPGHDGGTLTDTMILATIKVPETKDDPVKVGLVSIPRDLAVYIPGYEYRKINSAYAFGELKGEGQGAKLAVQTVESVIGKSIPYYAVLDFQGFRKIIDDLGGVDINVPVNFSDSQYPNTTEGYLPTLTFDAGQQHMDGERALEYARSRHGNNGQGSDFARSKRQQQIIEAVTKEVKGINIITNLSLINKILDDLANHFRTNLQLYEMKRIYDLTKNIDFTNISTSTIDGASGLVCDQINEENGAYLLIPCAGLGKYQEIRDTIQNQFFVTPVVDESAKIEIQNATTIPLFAQRASQFLQLSGLDIQTGNFKGGASYLKTIIYDNTDGKKPQTLDYLQKKLDAQVAASPFPFPTQSNKPDFVIVITADLESKIP